MHTLYKPLTYSTFGKKGKPRLYKGYSRIRGKGTGGKGRRRRMGNTGKESKGRHRREVERRKTVENAGEGCPRALQLGLAMILHHGRLPYRFPILYTSTFGPLWS